MRDELFTYLERVKARESVIKRAGALILLALNKYWLNRWIIKVIASHL